MTSVEDALLTRMRDLENQYHTLNASIYDLSSALDKHNRLLEGRSPSLTYQAGKKIVVTNYAWATPVESFDLTVVLHLVKHLNDNRLIDAIRTLRADKSSLSLKEAKDIVENIRATMTVIAAKSS